MTQNNKQPSDDPKYWARTGKQLAASALSGWVDASITYPAEYTKVMLQLQGSKGNPKVTGPIEVVKTTIKTHGFLGLYRGFSVVFVGNVPKYISRFGAYEQIKRLLIAHNNNGTQQLTSGQKLLCGLGAGVIEALVAVIPIESVKVKFINDRLSETPKYRGLASGISSIFKEKGVKGVYSGVAATVLKQATNQAVRFSVFESLKEWWVSSGRSGQSKTVSPALYPVFGMIAGGTSVLVNAPIDAVKTRLQGLQASQYSSTLDCALKLYKNEGVKAFYRGAGVRMVKCGAEVAIAFTGYNLFLDLFGGL